MFKNLINKFKEKKNQKKVMVNVPRAKVKRFEPERAEIKRFEPKKFEPKKFEPERTNVFEMRYVDTETGEVHTFDSSNFEEFDRVMSNKNYKLIFG